MTHKVVTNDKLNLWVQCNKSICEEIKVSQTKPDELYEIIKSETQGNIIRSTQNLNGIVVSTLLSDIQFNEKNKFRNIL